MEDPAFSPWYDLAPPPPPSLLSCQQVVSISQSSRVLPVQLTDNGGGGGCGGGGAKSRRLTHSSIAEIWWEGKITGLPASSYPLPLPPSSLCVLHGEMENISKGPTFGDFVTITTEALIQDISCKTTEYKSTDSPLPLF